MEGAREDEALEEQRGWEGSVLPEAEGQERPRWAARVRKGGRRVYIREPSWKWHQQAPSPAVQVHGFAQGAGGRVGGDEARKAPGQEAPGLVAVGKTEQVRSYGESHSADCAFPVSPSPWAGAGAHPCREKRGGARERAFLPGCRPHALIFVSLMPGAAPDPVRSVARPQAGGRWMCYVRWLVQVCLPLSSPANPLHREGKPRPKEVLSITHSRWQSWSSCL